KSSDEEDDDEVSLNDDAQDNDNQDDDDDEQTNSDNDGDDFVHPKFSTHDDEARQEEVNEEDSFDPRVQTPSHDESTDDDNSDEEVQGTNTEEEEMVEEATHEEDEANELYRDVNINLEGRDTVMTDAPLPNVQATQETEDTHVILTAPINPEGQQQSSSVSSGFVSNMLNPRPDTGIDSIFNTEATSLVDVSVTTIAEPPLVFATTLPPPPTPLITHMQQIPVPTPTTVSSSSLQHLPNFGSLFGLRDEAQAENADFLNKLDDNIKKIIKDQVKEQVKAQVSNILPKIEKLVNDQCESEVLIRSSNEAKTSHAIAANLSELEQKKILIDKIEANKPIDMSYIQKNLYKALVNAYDADKDILDAYGDTVTIKRHRDDANDDEEPFAGSNRGKKDLRESFNELIDTPLDFSAFVMNHLKVDTLTPELLAGLTFENVESSAGFYDKHALWGISHWGQKRQQFYGFVVNREFARDVYSKCRIIVVTKIEIVEWHNYKHLDWITVRKLTNLTIEERLAFNVSLRMFTRSIVIQRRMEDLQLDVESYQKKLNLTKPDTYRPNLKRREAYTAYSNPRGFIYQNKDKKNILIRIDELHKFSDSTLDDVRTALNDRLKGI
ncbi:hypothetical protein Tco_1037419, partial [Tanacetum coccineum]